MIRKAVFPVAGLGTRFLPATKAHPKEMLPIVDKPLIQFAAEEAAAAGIEELIFVTNHSKRAIEDHFDSNFELEARLKERDHAERLAIVQNILPNGVTCVYVRQQQPLGLGHAILCAKNLIKDEPFAVLLADDFIMNKGQSCLQQMVDIYRKQQCNILAVERISPAESRKYGIISSARRADGQIEVNEIIEKPSPEEAPSNLAVVGRYILNSSIFAYLSKTPTGAGGEIQLTDAIAAQLQNELVLAHEFTGTRYDCGSKYGYLQATVQCALQHPEIAPRFTSYLQSLQTDAALHS